MLTKRLASEAEIGERLAHISELNTLPIVLYGAGLHASEIEAYLKSRNINVSGCFVNDGYLNSTHRVTLPVESFNAIKCKFDKFNVIVAFCSDPCAVRERLNKIIGEEVNSVQFIDCRFWREFKTMKLVYIKENEEMYDKVYSSFSDEKSKNTYVEFINAKLLRDPAKLHALYSRHQYFPEDLPLFSITTADVFIDGGAFTGDTLEDVLAITGGKGCAKYYAFEPDAQNVRQLMDFVCRENLSFVAIQAKGLWSHQAVLGFSGNTGSSSSISTSGEIKIEVDAIDRLNIPATFIKMDIEGAEYEALVGAAKTIRKHCPNLAIALYHKPEDLLQIPIYIKSLCPDYRLYLRIHGYYSEELVLYATVRD